MQSNLIGTIEDAWGWTGLQPFLVVDENDFGNLIIEDKSGRFWRLCPEDLYCEVIAENQDELNKLLHDQEFLHDWNMTSLLDEERAQLELLRPGYKYCLKIPGPLGGDYGGSNLATIPLCELVAVSGDIARQIAGLPDGTQVLFDV